MDGVHALTDVTGFGLLGHLLELCRGSQRGRDDRLRRMPLHPGVLELARAGIVTGASAPQLGWLWKRGRARAPDGRRRAGAPDRSADVGRPSGRVRAGGRGRTSWRCSAPRASTAQPSSAHRRRRPAREARLAAGPDAIPRTQPPATHRDDRGVSDIARRALRRGAGDHAATRGAAVGRGLRAAVDARREPGQVAPGAHDVVLRNVRSRTLHSRLPAFDPRFRVLFNSYYNAVGDKHPRPDRGLLSRPTLDEVHSYRRHVEDHLVAARSRKPPTTRSSRRCWNSACSTNSSTRSLSSPT